ncbi:hypothetical protein [Algoriphagus boritolerans]|uniref:hypothetical protein n=1 Tax=Algoriphagus boritolerans TaxID=308111 RepID=UPI002FCE2C36
MANATEFGLAASIWTSDLKKRGNTGRGNRKWGSFPQCYGGIPAGSSLWRN